MKKAVNLTPSTFTQMDFFNNVAVSWLEDLLHKCEAFAVLASLSLQHLCLQFVGLLFPVFAASQLFSVTT